MLRTRIGAFTVTRVEEMLTPGFDPAFLFPEFDPAIYDEEPLLASAAFRDAASGKTMSSMQSWLVRDDRNVIVIDTGCGNGKAARISCVPPLPHAGPAVPRPARRSGCLARGCHHVINTHLHVDHVGWNTVRAGDRWTPTFPNARYFFGADELANWLDPATAARVPETTPVIEDSVRPVVEAGIVETVKAGRQDPPRPFIRGDPRPYARAARGTAHIAGRERLFQR